MSTEYYIIKPRTSEKFYLGKQPWYMLYGISRRNCKKPDYSDYKDVMVDIIRADCCEGEDTVEYITTLACEIFDFVTEEEVQIVSDWDTSTFWLNYEEINSIEDITRRVYGDI